MTRRLTFLYGYDGNPPLILADRFCTYLKQIPISLKDALGRPLFHTLPEYPVKSCCLVYADGTYFDGLVMFKSSITAIYTLSHILLNDTPFSAIDKYTGSQLLAIP